MIQQKKSGFTLIEMLLAMTFVSFLMVTIALTSISMARTYQRGTTLSDVNAAGRAVTTDIRRTVSQAPATTAKGVTNSPFIMKTSTTGGALCLGSYSYVWNNGTDIAASAKAGQLIKYKNTSTPVRLAKVLDPQEAECSGSAISAPLQSDSTELLPVGTGNGYNGLALHRVGNAQALTITQIAADPSQALYQVDFSIGTDDPSAMNLGTTIQTSNCKPPNDEQSNFNYCAINHFSFIVRAGGGVYDASAN